MAGFINGAVVGAAGQPVSGEQLNLTRTSAGQWMQWSDGTDVVRFFNRAGSPEGSIAADIGSVAIDSTNGDMYVKSTDTANTGWRAMPFLAIDQVSTTDATLTTIKTITLATDTVTTYKGIYANRRTDTSAEGAGGEVLVTARNDGGVCAIVGVTIINSNEDYAAGNPDVSAAISGVDLLIQVTGVAATPIDWLLSEERTVVI